MVSPKFQPDRKAVTFASRMSGTLAKRFSRKSTVDSVGRPYSQDSSPRANMFFAREASLRDSPNSLTASTVIPVRSTGWRAYSSREPSSSGFAAYPALVRLRVVKSAESTMTVAPLGRSPRLARSAAGFIATSTSGASPGVRMSWSAKWTWNDETPGSVPWGARISAGKLGRVDRSLPNAADSCVKRSPVSCMPSPESPANLMMTRSSCLTCLVTSVLSWVPVARVAPTATGTPLHDSRHPPRIDVISHTGRGARGFPPAARALVSDPDRGGPWHTSR